MTYLIQPNIAGTQTDLVKVRIYVLGVSNQLFATVLMMRLTTPMINLVHTENFSIAKNYNNKRCLLSFYLLLTKLNYKSS